MNVYFLSNRERCPHVMMYSAPGQFGSALNKSVCHKEENQELLRL